MKKILKISATVVIAFIGIAYIYAKVKRIAPLSWGHKEVNQPMFSDEAINGYDPVAYFIEKKAIEGLNEINVVWKDAHWYISTEANKALFIANPDEYTPQLGGYCAFAASQGFSANTTPQSFTFIDTQLYLFADDDMKAEWLKNIKTNQALSEKNWSY